MLIDYSIKFDLIKTTKARRFLRGIANETHHLNFDVIDILLNF